MVPVHRVSQGAREDETQGRGHEQGLLGKSPEEVDHHQSGNEIKGQEQGLLDPHGQVLEEAQHHAAVLGVMKIEPALDHGGDPRRMEGPRGLGLGQLIASQQERDHGQDQQVFSRRS